MFEDKVHEVERLIIDEGYNELEAWRMVLTPYLLAGDDRGSYWDSALCGKEEGKVK